LIFYQNRSSVITLNYDTLVERVAGMQSWKLSRGIPTGLLYPIPLTPAAQRGQTQLTPGPVETFKLFKLHGSINWFYSGASDFFGETLYFVPCLGGVDSLFTSTTTEPGPERNHWADTHDKVSLIIPPTVGAWFCGRKGRIGFEVTHFFGDGDDRFLHHLLRLVLA